MTVVPDPPNLFNVWLDLCMSHEVRGRQVFDARIAAFMLATAVTRLLTFNGRDLSRFPGIQTLAPA